MSFHLQITVFSFITQHNFIIFLANQIPEPPHLHVIKHHSRYLSHACFCRYILQITTWASFKESEEKILILYVHYGILWLCKAKDFLQCWFDAICFLRIICMFFLLLTVFLFLQMYPFLLG